MSKGMASLAKHGLVRYVCGLGVLTAVPANITCWYLHAGKGQVGEGEWFHL